MEGEGGSCWPEHIPEWSWLLPGTAARGGGAVVLDLRKTPARGGPMGEGRAQIGQAIHERGGGGPIRRLPCAAWRWCPDPSPGESGPARRGGDGSSVGEDRSEEHNV